MQEIAVRKDQPTECEHVRVLQGALKDRDRRRKAKIYRTRTSCDQREYDLVTTSKDIHLGFGTLTEGVRWHLAALIFEEYERGGDAVVMLDLDGECLLATIVNRVITPVEIVTIHISPAR